MLVGILITSSPCMTAVQIDLSSDDMLFWTSYAAGPGDGDCDTGGNLNAVGNFVPSVKFYFLFL
jgi:hypothetical protein